MDEFRTKFQDAAEAIKEGLDEERLQSLITGMSYSLSSMVLSGDYESGEDRNYLISVAALLNGITS
mgnify:CR=1 FL=1